MFPILVVPQNVREWMDNFRNYFHREAGFDYVCRYVAGLIISPNKTLQGIHDLQVWEDKEPRCRTMHEAVFETDWGSGQLMPCHRKLVSPFYCGQGRYVISLDWTLGHHERGPQIYGVKKGFDYTQNRYCNIQTIMTAVVSNEKRIDGIDIEIQEPGYLKEEKIYLEATVKNTYDQVEEARNRIGELFHYHLHVKSYKKRTEIVVEQVKRIEEEGHFPDAHYAFDNGVLNLNLTKTIESFGKHWVSELECSRNVFWDNEWKRIDEVAKYLKEDSPQSFRFIQAPQRSGKCKDYWVFTKVLRLKKGYGKKRIAIVHERSDLQDNPRFLITDALHWESKRILNVWSYRWSSEIFHEFGKQCTGLESAQLRNEEGVKRHLRLSCIAQSILQNVPSVSSTSEKFTFAQGQSTLGQKWRSIMREVFQGVLMRVKRFILEGKEVQDIMNILMPV